MKYERAMSIVNMCDEETQKEIAMSLVERFPLLNTMPIERGAAQRATIIVATVAKFYGYKHEEIIFSHHRNAVVSKIRAISSVLLRDVMLFSYKEITRYISVKDHASVMAAIERNVYDEDFWAIVKAITVNLEVDYEETRNIIEREQNIRTAGDRKYHRPM